MIFDDPVATEKFGKAFCDLAELSRTDDELYLLLAVVRAFGQIKKEQQEKKKREAEYKNNQIEKLKAQVSATPAALHLVKK